jgi:hypothetical protein
MKINIEIDMTPEELRQTLGLPDVQGFQQTMLDQFVERLQSSTEQREEFMRTLVSGAMQPWQALAKMAWPGSDSTKS